MSVRKTETICFMSNSKTTFSGRYSVLVVMWQCGLGGTCLWYALSCCIVWYFFWYLILNRHRDMLILVFP